MRDRTWGAAQVLTMTPNMVSLSLKLPGEVHDSLAQDNYTTNINKYYILFMDILSSCAKTSGLAGRSVVPSSFRQFSRTVTEGSVSYMR